MDQHILMNNIHNPQMNNQYYAKFNTEDLKRLVKMITINKEEDMLVVKDRIEQVFNNKVL